MNAAVVDVTTGVKAVNTAPGVAVKTLGQNEWTYTVSPAASNTYSVFVEVDDTKRNASSTGDDPAASDMDIATGHTFEIDNEFNNGVAAVVVEPETLGAAPAADIFIIRLTFASAGSEYPGDSDGTVTITKAELDGDDVIDTLEVRSEGRDVTFAIENVAEGDHTLVYSAEDSLGNKVEDQEVDITVVDRPAWTLTLSRGLNLISLPALPESTNINDVFGGNEDIDLVFTFDGTLARVAHRVDTSAPFDVDGSNPIALLDVDASNAYFVNAVRGTTVDINIPPLGASVPPLLTVGGGEWALVPVISLEQPGDIGQGTAVDASDYLGSPIAAFRFQRTGLAPLETDNNNEQIVRIGEGYWVLYAPSTSQLLTPVVLPD